MELCALKNVNNCLNTNIYSHSNVKYRARLKQLANDKRTSLLLEQAQLTYTKMYVI